MTGIFDFFGGSLTNVDPILINTYYYKKAKWLRGKKKISELPRFNPRLFTKYIIPVSIHNVPELIHWTVEETVFEWNLIKETLVRKMGTYYFTYSNNEALILHKLKY